MLPGDAGGEEPGGSEALTSVGALESYLAALSGTSAETPAAVKLALNISYNWSAINTVVQSAGEYVVLDLSASSATDNTITGTPDLSYAPDPPSSSFSNGITEKRSAPSGNDMNVIKDNPHIKGVVLPDTLTSIYYGAFSGCTGLVSVMFAGSDISDRNFGSDAFPEGTIGDGGDTLEAAYNTGKAGTYTRESGRHDLDEAELNRQRRFNLRSFGLYPKLHTVEDGTRARASRPSHESESPVTARRRGLSFGGRPVVCHFEK